jgi:hypothetical protein
MRLVFPLLLGWAAGCGALIGPDVDDQPLSFPEREFRLDADELGLTSSVAVMPTVACGQCLDEVDSFCDGDDCRAVCDEGSDTCSAQVNVALSETYDLREDGIGFGGIEVDAPIVIDGFEFEIVTNTLDVATPVIEIYVAPVTVAAITDSRAKLIGTIRPLAPGEKGRFSLTFSADGRGHLQDVLDAYLTPFNLLVVTQVSVGAGEAVPTGMLVGKVRVSAHADLGG